MTISQYIGILRGIMETHGDLEVESWSPYRGRYAAISPWVAYQKILKGRQRKPEFWDKWEGDDQKGEKVCRI